MKKQDRVNSYLSKVSEELQKCVKCGECRSVCPVFAEHRREKFVARGKLALVEAVADGDLSFTDEFYKVLNNCILCLSCVENCSSGVKVDKIITAARAEFVDNRGLPLLKRFLFRVLTAGRGVMNFVTQSGALLQYILFKRIPKTSGLRRRFPLLMIDKTRYIPAFVRHPFRQSTSEVVNAVNPKDTVIFFTGCSTNYIYPKIAEAVVKVLNALSVNVIVPKGQTCCGSPVEAGGDHETAILLARRNIQTLVIENCGHKVVVPCSSGGYMLKRGYSDFFTNDPEWLPKAEALAARTYDISEYLVKEVGINEIVRHIRGTITQKTTYHDPCHLNRGQGIHAEPRALLKLACAEYFVEMEEPERCCGFGGTYGITHRETSNRIVSRKIKNIMDSKAQLVATGCPGCIIQLQDGMHQKGVNATVLHTIEVLARSMALDKQNLCLNSTH